MQDWIVLGDVIREQLLKFNFLLTSEMTLNDKIDPKAPFKATSGAHIDCTSVVNFRHTFAKSLCCWVNLRFMLHC